jgi:hypothetical protein
MQTTNSSGRGTWSWVSPERLSGDFHQLAAADDVYAYACLCYCVSPPLYPCSCVDCRRIHQLFAQHAPFHDLRDTAIIIKVCNGDRPARPPSHTFTGGLLSDDVWTLIEECWSQNALDRPDVSTARARLEAIIPSTSLSGTSQAGLSTNSPQSPPPLVRAGAISFTITLWSGTHLAHSDPACSNAGHDPDHDGHLLESADLRSCCCHPSRRCCARPARCASWSVYSSNLSCLLLTIHSGWGL